MEQLKDKMKIVEEYWKVSYTHGNDWGMPSYTEVEICENEQELARCLKGLGYYDSDVKIKRVATYDYGYQA